MSPEEMRAAENFAITVPLQHIEDADMLAFLATLIQDHDHLREKLMTEPDRKKRRAKLDAMRPHLVFRADTPDGYEMAEIARRAGVQPIYREQERMEDIWMPPSFVHEVRG